MPKTYTPPQGFETEPRPQIQLNQVESSQVEAIGYDPETKTLAVRFTRGPGAIYHYLDVSPEAYEDFKAGRLGEDREPSIGVFFGQYIKPLPFKKYPAEQVTQ